MSINIETYNAAEANRISSANYQTNLNIVTDKVFTAILKAIDSKTYEGAFELLHPFGSNVIGKELARACYDYSVIKVVNHRLEQRGFKCGEDVTHDSSMQYVRWGLK